MVKIRDVALEINLSDGGRKARANVDYVLEFTESEVVAGVQYNELCHLITDNRNSDDWTPADPEDLTPRGAPHLVDFVTTARRQPIERSVTSDPFDAKVLDTEPFRDEIRARVRLRPTSKFAESFRGKVAKSDIFSLG